MLIPLLCLYYEVSWTSPHSEDNNSDCCSVRDVLGRTLFDVSGWFLNQTLTIDKLTPEFVQFIPLSPGFLVGNVLIFTMGRLQFCTRLLYLFGGIVFENWLGFVGAHVLRPFQLFECVFQHVARVSACIFCFCSMCRSCCEAPAESSAASCAVATLYSCCSCAPLTTDAVDSSNSYLILAAVASSSPFLIWMKWLIERLESSCG